MSKKIQIIDRQAAYAIVTAIVKQATSDWKDAMKILEGSPDNIHAKRLKVDCEKFFLSNHFLALTGVEGKCLLDRLEEEYNRDCKTDSLHP